jgi:hypothetical protein
VLCVLRSRPERGGRAVAVVVDEEEASEEDSRVQGR